MPEVIKINIAELLTLCSDLGLAQTLRSRGGQHRNRQALDFQKDLATNTRGFQGEAAFKLWTDWQYIPPLKWLKLDGLGREDFSNEHVCIDVKATSQAHYSLMEYRAHIRPHWIYVLASTEELPVVNIRGFCTGLELRMAPQRRYGGMVIGDLGVPHGLKPHELNQDFEELLAHIRGERKLPESA